MDGSWWSASTWSSFLQSIKQPSCSGMYQESTFLGCYVSKQTPSHKVQNAFKDKMSCFNCKNEFPAWTHWLVEQPKCEVGRNLKEELSFQKNGSNLVSQFPKHLKHKLMFKCTVVPAVLTGQFARLKHTSAWFTGLYQCLMTWRVQRVLTDEAGGKEPKPYGECVTACDCWGRTNYTPIPLSGVKYDSMLDF